MAGLFAVYMALFITWFGPGVDSHAYWAAWRGPMYDAAPATPDAYLYTPAFAQALWPLAQLPWPVFGVLWSLAAAATLVWLVRNCTWYTAVPLLMIGLHEVVSGNVNWLMALVAVHGLRHPSLWAFPALTKLVPCVGPIWFLVRREWRPLTVSILATAAIGAVSWAISPHLWSEWFQFIGSNAASSGDQVGGKFLPPLTYRLPIIVALVAWGAWRDRPWVLPVAMLLASPVVGPGQLVLLLALPRINAEARAGRRAQDRAGTREPSSDTTDSPS